MKTLNLELIRSWERKRELTSQLLNGSSSSNNASLKREIKKIEKRIAALNREQCNLWK